MFEATISLVPPSLAIPLFGTRDRNVALIREALGIQVTHREGRLQLAAETQEALKQGTSVFEQLKALVERKGEVSADDVTRTLQLVTGVAPTAPTDTQPVTAGVRMIKPKTPGQAAYLDAIRKHDLVFAVGPAGTGKTFLAVAAAVEALKKKQIRKIVLVRPAVEAGENLGFLPGDLQAKINPYLRPLLDSLNAILEFDEMKRLMEQDVIEVAPLAYMRGRTLNESFIILDEGQNTTVPQMKMFLTRMGENSKIVVSGDPTQIDLPAHAKSGLSDAMERLHSIEGVTITRLTGADIVRHRLVQAIVNAYESGEGARR